MSALAPSRSAAALQALVGWQSTEARWQAFWDRWSDGQILSTHWLRRDAAQFKLTWFGGELQLEFTYEPGTLTAPETWALRSLTLIAPEGRRPGLDWGVGIDLLSADLGSVERHLGVSSRRHANGASFFLSRPDGVELAIQLDWISGYTGALRAYTIASLGAPKG
ncbi:hypothetical protein CDL60_07205 [Roseateles noduli]|nr:hypothetical protein CDL60_07205 [Roseateles noduli]